MPPFPIKTEHCPNCYSFKIYTPFWLLTYAAFMAFFLGLIFILFFLPLGLLFFLGTAIYLGSLPFSNTPFIKQKIGYRCKHCRHTWKPAMA